MKALDGAISFLETIVLVLMMLVGIMMMSMACGGNYFVTASTEYPTTGDPVEDAAKVVMALAHAGYDIESLDRNIVETKIRREQHAEGTIHEVEFQTWIRVYLRTGKIEIHCTERKMWSYHPRTMKLEYNQNWRFTQCKHPVIIQHVNETLRSLNQYGGHSRR